MIKNTLINKDYIFKNLTNDTVKVVEQDGKVYEREIPVEFRWTHGATDYHLGDGLLIYSIISYMRAKNCVCLGSGGGFVPRLMTQARIDLYETSIFEGKKEFNWGDIGTTYLVDAANGIGGEVNYLDESSFFRSTFFPRFINDTTENAYYNFFVKQDIKIDYLHIDADHSYEGVKKDFELYSKILSPNGIISIHDTDKKFTENYIVSQDIKEQNKYDDFGNGPSKFIEEIGDEWQRFDFFNEGVLRNKPSSTGLTLLRHG